MLLESELSETLPRGLRGIAPLRRRDDEVPNYFAVRGCSDDPLPCLGTGDQEG